ncbi:DUF420 domain-containing protein [Sulfurovum sp. zt1-1]|uniref:DUF420 domain-containing protein n=1 Tax=Sulfurovum zhangzhouensis TaxID=3019067 RepID=A0ABT7QZH2_9BACT|nr:DUF420 domain-containing protein [Sulfurovum zhangzhouensis]MDM5272249.1 DUF420 domain-containing protein [Sulfurovum zhangzhouensis]
MFEAGFLGTRAPLFMDIVTIIVALLPFLILGAISLAKRKLYNLHATVQKILFIVSVIVVVYFEYGVRNVGGFDAFMEGSSTPKGYAFWVLIFHIAIAVVTLGIWINTLLRAKRDRRMNVLPGMYSISHKKAGMRTFTGIVLTSVTGIWVYYLLFVN